MHMKISKLLKSSCPSRAFGAALLAVGVFGTLFASFHAAFSAGSTVMRVAREEPQETQLVAPREETVRLQTWAHLSEPAHFKTTFSNTDAPLGKPDCGTVIKTQPVNVGAPSHLADIQTLKIPVRWTNGIAKHQSHVRELQTQATIGPSVYKAAFWREL